MSCEHAGTRALSLSPFLYFFIDLHLLIDSPGQLYANAPWCGRRSGVLGSCDPGCLSDLRYLSFKGPQSPGLSRLSKRGQDWSPPRHPHTCLASAGPRTCLASCWQRFICGDSEVDSGQLCQEGLRCISLQCGVLRVLGPTAGWDAGSRICGE